MGEIDWFLKFPSGTSCDVSQLHEASWTGEAVCKWKRGWNAGWRIFPLRGEKKGRVCCHVVMTWCEMYKTRGYGCASFITECLSLILFINELSILPGHLLSPLHRDTTPYRSLWCSLAAWCGKSWFFEYTFSLFFFHNQRAFFFFLKNTLLW